MKKTLVNSLLFSVVPCVLALSSFSPVLPTLADTIEKDQGFVAVNSSTTKEIAPNQAEISINIETYDKSMQKASADNKLIADKVYSSLKKLLGATDYIKTSNYTARPQYSYTKDNKKAFDKYIVTNSVVVRTKNINLVSRLVDTAIGQGATSVDNLQFSVSDYDCACSDALAEVTKKAYSQANSVANSINTKITGVKSINATCNSENSPRPYYAMMPKDSMDGVSATPIDGGKIKINVNIDASFYVN